MRNQTVKKKSKIPDGYDSLINSNSDEVIICNTLILNIIK